MLTFVNQNLLNDRTGEIRYNHFGTPMKIISYRNTGDIDIEFQDKHKYIVKHTSYINFKTGSITNPFDITVYGVGCFGVGKHKSSYEKGIVYAGYKTWADMLKRCYRTKYKDMYPAYYNIATVCDEWHCYQIFADWYEENKYEVDERLHIDKDILFPGNKLYEPEKCLLVPQRINMLFSNKKNKQGLPNGINRTKNGRYHVLYNKNNLGTYSNIKDAIERYSYAKESAIRSIAEEYREIIPEKLYIALLEYRVDVKADKNFVA